ncbi:MAG: protoheme IX farnesyltransferase [Anaerolineae bacterium]|nr:protoheme IX farnesyltransferase [Anaerolineae bacterium]
MSTATPPTATPSDIKVHEHGSARPGLWGSLVVLFKLRVVVLLLFAAWGGAMLGSAGSPARSELALLLITGALSASGASALNQYLERHTDGAMKRTARRPLVTGQVNPRGVLIAGTGMVLGASGIAWIAGNPALAVWLAVGALIYVGIYTLWLKPRSTLNVVIGGAAGSAAVLAGGAAVGDWTDPGVIGLALLLFAWSPMHFWSLALAYRADYARAGVPMLPVVAARNRAIFWMLVHAAGTGLVGLLLARHESLGWPYLLPTAPVTVWLWAESVRLRAQYDGARALRLFKISNLYLALVLLAITVAAVV